MDDDGDDILGDNNQLPSDGVMQPPITAVSAVLASDAEAAMTTVVKIATMVKNCISRRTGMEEESESGIYSSAANRLE